MAETKIFTLGLSKIEVGDIGTDGAMGATLAQLGFTSEDTCKLTQEDATTTDFNAEEADDPVLSISKPGKITLAFSVMNPSVTVMAKLLGGTADETNGTWSAPDQVGNIEQSVRITPQQGFKFEIPRMQLITKINGEFSKKNLLVLEVTGTVLQPTKSGLAKMTATKLA